MQTEASKDVMEGLSKCSRFCSKIWEFFPEKKQNKTRTQCELIISYADHSDSYK